MAGHTKYKDKSSLEDQTKKRRTFQNNQSNQTDNLSTEAPCHMEDPQCIPHHLTKTIQGNQSLQSQLP